MLSPTNWEYNRKKGTALNIYPNCSYTFQQWPHVRTLLGSHFLLRL